MTGNYIRVTMYDDRLEILSPGKLPNLVTVDNIQETRFSRNPQIARVLTEFGLVRELNEDVKRIYADMKEQNLDSPIYTENDHSVTLILKNNIEERTVKAYRSVGAKTTDQTDQTTDQTNNESTEKKILFLIEYNLRLTQAQIADELDVPKSTVKYYVSKLSKAKIIKREGTVHNGRWIIL